MRWTQWGIQPLLPLLWRAEWEQNGFQTALSGRTSMASMPPHRRHHGPSPRLRTEKIAPFERSSVGIPALHFGLMVPHFSIAVLINGASASLSDVHSHATREPSIQKQASNTYIVRYLMPKQGVFFGHLWLGATSSSWLPLHSWAAQIRSHRSLTLSWGVSKTE